MDYILTNQAVMSWLFSANENEYHTYSGTNEWMVDLSALEQCIFLDLIDHSEAE